VEIKSGNVSNIQDEPPGDPEAADTFESFWLGE
jgi:hypothetical protein